MPELTLEKKLHYTLRFAVAMCFIGHGAFGIITKPIWCNYFAVFGIGHDLSYRLMPLLGSLDIFAGLVMLVFPMRAIPAWLVFWGIVTACLRPLSGEPFAEFIERAGNFGAPLALLILARTPLSANGIPEGGVSGATGLPSAGGRSFRGWFRRMDPGQSASADTLRQVAICLRIVVFFLLAGHGWLNLIEKKELIAQYTSIGFSNPHLAARVAGVFEIVAACLVLILPLLPSLIRSFRPLLLAFFIWKAGTELFYPHWELFEWVERGGSYGSLLALWFIARQPLGGIIRTMPGHLPDGGRSIPL
jgi:hypothetical protein